MLVQIFVFNRDIKIDRKKLAEELTEMQRQLSAERQDTDDKAAQLTRIEAALREQKHLTREKEEHGRIKFLS